jgi:hypothetical protein
MFRRMLLVHCQAEFTKDVNALIQAIKVRTRASTALHYCISTLYYTACITYTVA